jgi:threonine/homoserine/homoserine lactone efflux protein
LLDRGVETVMLVVSPQLLAYMGLVAALSITPGATTMLVARSVIERGRHAGFMVILGGSVGMLAHAALSGLGLSLILVQSALLFAVVKWLGALYLVFLGARSVWRAMRQPSDRLALLDELSGVKSRAGRDSFVEGLVTVVLSPEAAVFYLAVVPQFINPGESMLYKSFLLVGIHMVVRLIWYSILTIFVGRITVWLKRPRAQKGLELSSGALLILFGVRVAVAVK